ncbi:MAG: hypothetical protein EXR83_12685 [Gammaproteobacteria bacterium]|nr:hypothetical protein [Gammaproteobacteria bacterium]
MRLLSFVKVGFVLAIALNLNGCSEDQQNKISRLGVSWLEGNYRVTFATGNHLKSWEIQSGKVTTEPGKGYYYFWTEVEGKKRYVQVPIEHTYIEEIP